MPCALLLVASGSASAQESLCAAGEAVVFACHAGAKMVSLCRIEGSRKELVYRYGVPGKIELQFPNSAKGEEGVFASSTVPLFGGGITSVSFTRGGYSYSVYSKLSRTRTRTGEQIPEFEDGVAVLRGGRTLRKLVCSDGGAGFLESLEWLPEATTVK